MELSKSLETLRSGWRNLIVGICGGVLVFGAYAFLAPKWYESWISVVPTSPGRMPSALAGALNLDIPMDLFGGGADTERIQSVLKSRSVTDAVIEKFDLTKRYRERFIENTRKTLWNHCETKIDKKPNVVTITCEDKDPHTAQAMVAYFGEVGNRMMKHISSSSAAEERRFLEQRVAESKKDVNEAAERVREFEEKHRIIDLPEQSRAVVSAIASINGDLLSKQLELDYLRGISSSDESSAVQLRRQVGVMQSKMQSLEDLPADADSSADTPAPATSPKRTSTAKPKSGQGIFPIAMTVPKLRFEIGALYRQQKIQETLFLLLTERFEMARVNEARDTSAFQVLDDPVVATHQSHPKRVVSIIAGMLLGLLAGAAFTLRNEILPHPPGDRIS